VGKKAKGMCKGKRAGGMGASGREKEGREYDYRKFSADFIYLFAKI
jgi:hypothetical protein